MQQEVIEPFRLVDIDRDIAEEVRRRRPHPLLQVAREAIDYAPPAVRAPLPDYVVHREGVDDIGKLTAEAVVKEYELAAKEVESMGTELAERLKKLEETKADTLMAIDAVKDTAARYRDEGKRIFLQIEDCALLTAEVRTTCTALAGKITGTAVVVSST